MTWTILRDALLAVAVGYLVVVLVLLGGLGR